MNWDNVFAAGGSVLGCLLRPPAAYDVDNKTRRDYFHNVGYAGSDVDLFLYGLNEEEGIAKLDEVYNAIVDACPHEVVAIRSAFAITIVSQYPFRHVQIVLRLFSSPAGARRLSFAAAVACAPPPFLRHSALCCAVVLLL